MPSSITQQNFSRYISHSTRLLAPNGRSMMLKNCPQYLYFSNPPSTGSSIITVDNNELKQQLHSSNKIKTDKRQI